MTETAELGRLTYTSFDQDGTGGWQIKEQVGLSDDEATALRSRVLTQLDPGFELPRFPSPDEVARLPRRLVYAPIDHARPVGAVGWWHTAPAGLDASGRPGNVFAHVVLDRGLPRRGSSVRPIDLWRSPDWLSPYAADAVLAATLPVRPEIGPGPAVTTQTVVEFLFDFSHFRFGTLGLLLDACAAALTGGRRVVLGTATVDTAALWLGAVSHLMPAGFARRFFFSTLERPGTVGVAFDQGVHIACVPRTDLDAFSARDDYLVLEEDEDIEIGDLGGRPHRTAGGHEVPVTEWSVMAQVVLFDVPTAVGALKQLDATMAELPEPGGEPGWGLAVVISQHQDDFGDARWEAGEVISRSSPAQLPDDSGVLTLASDLISDRVGSTEDAWARLNQPGVAGAPLAYMTRMLLGHYASRVLADRGWLTRLGGVPLPEGATLLEEDAGPLAATAQQLLSALLAADTPERELVVGVAALTNFCARIGLVHDSLLAEDLRNAIDAVLGYRLLSPDGPALVADLGPFAEVTQATFVRPQLELDEALQRGRPGDRVPPPVLAWLFTRPPRPEAITPRLRVDGTRLRAELAVQLTRADPQRFARERPLALWSTLAAQRTGVSAPLDLEVFFAGPPWSAAELMDLETAFPNRLPLARFAATIGAAPASPSLSGLCDRLRDRPPSLSYEPLDDPVRALVALRRCELDRWTDTLGPAFDRQLEAVVHGGAALPELPDVTLHPDATAQLRVGAILAAVLGRHRIPLAALRNGLGVGFALTGPEWVLVQGALGAHVPDAQVVFTALAPAPRFPDPEGVTDGRFSWLEACRVAEGGELVPVLVAYLRGRLTDVADLEQLSRQVAEVGRPYVVKYSSNAERSVRSLERFAQHWLKTQHSVKNSQSADGRPSRWKARP